MKDKSMCWKCKYHTYMGNLPAKKLASGYEALSEGERANIACFYSVIAKSSALKPNGAKNTVDIRGDGSECALFVEGKKDIKEHKREFTRDLGRFAR